MLRREGHAGVRTGAYLESKLALLTPILLLVNGTMIIVLRALDRIPNLSAAAPAQLYVTMALNALAALCLGLLASAAVTAQVVVTFVRADKPVTTLATTITSQDGTAVLDGTAVVWRDPAVANGPPQQRCGTESHHTTA